MPVWSCPSGKEPPMTGPGSPPGAGPDRDGVHLRLLWPQWQGAGTSSVRELAPEFPFDVARRGYAVGSAVLAAVLPPHDGPTAAVPVTMSGDGLAVAALTGHGDPDVLALLPAIVPPGRVALAGLHAWADDDFPNVAGW